MSLQTKLKTKYGNNYKKVFDRDFRETVKRADLSRRIFYKYGFNKDFVEMVQKSMEDRSWH